MNDKFYFTRTDAARNYRAASVIQLLVCLMFADCIKYAFLVCPQRNSIL